MNIDDIEKNLNNYEVNPERAIALILNAVANNQALLNTILDLQAQLIAFLTETDIKIVSKDVEANLKSNLALIQAAISSSMGEGEN